ncbi:tannase and feruloyl esterase [Penicillium malachiteum]|nr:tannase and feruloyl esterase [Penicillium malachiteum]
MAKFASFGVLVAVATLTQATSLAEMCTDVKAKAAVPSTGLLPGIVTSDLDVTANPVYNETVSGEDYYPDATFSFCNVTMSYSHNGKDDKVLLNFWLPSPEKFSNRWVSTGGFGFAINAESNLPGGVIYGAATGRTDGGFGGFDVDFDGVFPLANGTSNLEALYMFGYQAHSEMSSIGKAFTKNFRPWRLKAVQRFPDEWDGAVIGAPAIRYGQQQVNHLFPQVVEKTLDYAPPYCELEKIVNLTISACDPLDGKADGVVGRSDLCKLHFDFNSTIGEEYYCASSGSTPAQSGSVTKAGAKLADTIYNGLLDSESRRAYFWYQYGAEMEDAETEYSSSTGEWDIDISSLGGEWVTRCLQLLELDNLSTLEGVSYDNLRDWMLEGLQRYEDVMQTTWPDLSRFEAAGGKIISYHGEQDPSIPTASSFRLFLVPGAAHCATNSLQPNGPFPQTSLGSLIEWVEKDDMPVTLNATVLSGEHKGEQQQLCAWPLRPLWKNNGTTMNCFFNQESYDTWIYDLDAYEIPVY